MLKFIVAPSLIWLYFVSADTGQENKGAVKEQEQKSAGLEDPLSDGRLYFFVAIQLHLRPPPPSARES